jgi:hypothetical protein
MPAGPEEDIVRAICTDKWDGTHIAPSLFTGENVSVSRLAVIPLSEHWDMFRKHLEKPPERRLELIGEISVGRLQQLGRDYQRKVELTVEAKPEDWNPAHAEIPQRITRGLATQIVNALKRHKPPPQGGQRQS